MRKSVKVETLNNLEKPEEQKRNSVVSSGSAKDIA